MDKKAKAGCLLSSLKEVEAECATLGILVDEAIIISIAYDRGGYVALCDIRKELGYTNLQTSRLANRLDDNLLTLRIVSSEDQRNVILQLQNSGWDLAEAMEAAFGGAKQRRDLMDAASASLRGIVERMRTHKTTQFQERVLIALAERGEPMTASQVAEIAGIARTTATMALKSLLKRKFIVCDNASVSFYSMR